MNAARLMVSICRMTLLRIRAASTTSAVGTAGGSRTGNCRPRRPQRRRPPTSGVVRRNWFRDPQPGSWYRLKPARRTRPLPRDTLRRRLRQLTSLRPKIAGKATPGDENLVHGFDLKPRGTMGFSPRRRRQLTADWNRSADWTTFSHPPDREPSCTLRPRRVDETDPTNGPPSGHRGHIFTGESYTADVTHRRHHYTLTWRDADSDWMLAAPTSLPPDTGALRHRRTPPDTERRAHSHWPRPTPHQRFQRCHLKTL